MYGKNPISSQHLDPDGIISVKEIFHTIQGEGPLAGSPAVFVRTGGCNLRCFFCDTEFSNGLRTMSPVQVADKVDLLKAGKRCDLVVITGGEPFLHNLVPLCYLLEERGYHVQIETAGTLWIPGMEALIDCGVVELVCSPKTPKINSKIVSYCNNWKYIIRRGGTSSDGLPNECTQSRGMMQTLYRPDSTRRDGFKNITWVQPCDDGQVPMNKQNVDEAKKSAMRFGYRLSLQTHKILGMP